MSDKIMPMSEAVEGYDLFDKMKVQKGMPNMINVKVPELGSQDTSGFRSTEVTRSRSLRGMRDGRTCKCVADFAVFVTRLAYYPMRKSRK